MGCMSYGADDCIAAGPIEGWDPEGWDPDADVYPDDLGY